MRERESEIREDGKRWTTTLILVLIVVLTAAAIAVLVVVPRFDSWRGGGFRADGSEMPRLREVLTLRSGMTVADVGAGRGDLTMALAGEVGASGQVYSTDIDPNSIDGIRARVAEAGLRNVTAVQAQATDTGLPTACCEAVVMRRVYHHVSDPVATNVELLRAVRPGGVLAVIDFPPTLSWLWPWPPEGVPENRSGHGVTSDLVVDEVTAGGFELVQVIDDWPGRGPLGSYCAVFRRPRVAGASGRGTSTFGTHIASSLPRNRVQPAQELQVDRLR